MTFLIGVALGLVGLTLLLRWKSVKSAAGKMRGGSKNSGKSSEFKLKNIPWISAPIGLCVLGFGIAMLTTFFFSEDYEVDVYFVSGANAPCIRSNAIPGEGGTFILDSYETRQIRVPVGHRGCASSDPVGVVSWSRRNGEILVIGGPDTGPR